MRRSPVRPSDAFVYGGPGTERVCTTWPAYQGLPVLAAGRVFSLIKQFASVASLSVKRYDEVLRLLLHRLREKGHGGTIAILPRSKISCVASCKELAAPSTVLLDYVIAHRELSGRIQERDHLRDSVFFVADLASIDGALLLDRRLRVLGFGAHLSAGTDDVDAGHALNLNATEVGASPLNGLGTRHKSTAAYCSEVPDTLAFVVSEDGPISCMWRPPKEKTLLVWRPVALGNEWAVREGVSNKKGASGKKKTSKKKTSKKKTPKKKTSKKKMSKKKTAKKNASKKKRP